MFFFFSFFSPVLKGAEYPGFKDEERKKGCQAETAAYIVA